MRYLLRLGVLVVAGGVWVAQAAEPVRPRLAVVIAIDQFRADYLTRFRPYFGERGFKRLLEGGADFQSCYYRHAVTKTACGHATILSGVSADVHGIVSNEWLDQTSGQMVESVEDPAFPIVGAAAKATRSPGGALEAKAGRSPRAFLATTVGDQLKLRFGEHSRVFAVSNKDRSAILLGGKLADSAYWIDDSRFVTSRYYRETLPAWVEAFNVSGRVDEVYGKTWDRLLDRAVYDDVQGPDDGPGEAELAGLPRMFPKKIDGGRPEISTRFYDAFDVSPHAATIVGEFAQAAIREEKLGKHDATDLLCISFSQIDYAGHTYGPDSHEVMDSVVRLDRVLAMLLDTIDREVGLTSCVVVLTADHGVSPLPERVSALRADFPASRFDRRTLDASVIAALDAAYGALPPDTVWLTRDNFGYFLNAGALKAKNLPVATAAAVVRDTLRRSPQIALAFTRADIPGLPAEGDSLEAMSRRSYHSVRSADVVYVTKPYIIDRSTAGTTHGTPYNYDAHVPQLWFGAGVAPGVRVERVGVDDIAPTLAGLLALPLPAEARGRRLF